MRRRRGGECRRRCAPSCTRGGSERVGVRQHRRGGRLCKGRARQGGAGSTSDGWRRRRRAVRDATCAAPPSSSLPLPLPRGWPTGAGPPPPSSLRAHALQRPCSGVLSPGPRPASSPGSVCPASQSAAGGPRAHFADGETDARNPQMPRARSLSVGTQVCQNREPKRSSTY